jgi:hypothetical protein
MKVIKALLTQPEIRFFEKIGFLLSLTKPAVLA